MKKSVSFIAVLLVGLFACKNAPDKQQGPVSTKETVITSNDGMNQITLTGGWQEAQDLNKRAALGAADSLTDSYLICISDNKSDVQNTTLEQYAASTLKRRLRGFREAKVDGPAKRTINGNPAIQYEFHGIFHETRVAYIHTTVESSTQFNQIVAWTTEVKFPETRATILKIVDSFKQVQK